MKISVTIESQEGLNWNQWKRIAEEVESLGYDGVYRSDHFPMGDAALELIVSLAYLADHTERIQIGSLVAPFSFRDPAMLARQAAAIDDLSGGRLVLGLGAGWAENEHLAWGYNLGDGKTRSDRFKEGLHVMTQLLRSDEPVTFSGQYFQLQEARLLPPPQRPGGPKIMVGGNGIQSTLPLAARYADVWNGTHQTAENFAKRSAILDRLLQQEGRQPEDVKRTMMALVFCGKNEGELKQRAGYIIRNWAPQTADQPFEQVLEYLDSILDPLLNRLGGSFCPIVGTPDEALAQIRRYEEAGLEELILQWFDIEDLDGLRLYAEDILAKR